MRPILIIILLYSFIQSSGTNILKSDTLSKHIFSLDVREHYGFIIIHSEEIRAIKNSFPIGTELNFNWQKIDEKSWNLCYCYPRIGFLVSFFDYDNKEILGYGFNLAGFVESFFRTHKKFNVSFKIAAGLSLSTNPYDEIKNPDNLSYSLPINQYTQLGIIFHYTLSPKIKLNLASNYNHISNGGLKEPNKGINYPTIGIGMNYTPNPIEIPKREKIRNQTIKKRRYDISLSYFPKKIIDNPKYFTVFGINTGISQQIGKISALTANIEWISDGSLKWKIRNTNKNHQRAGILIGHEFLMGKFTFSQKIGTYIYDETKYNDSFYQRYGINFHVTKNLFTGIHIKAHRHIADFMEIKLGWTFN